MYRIFILIILPILLNSEGVKISPEIQKVLESVFANQRIDLQSEIISLPNPYLQPPRESNTTTTEINGTLEIKKEAELEAIMNRSAKIGEHWYKKGEEFEGFLVKKIDNDCVIIQKGDEIKKMCLKKVNENLEVERK